nr:hypothetical transcript [Hymenolepis microstoma]
MLIKDSSSYGALVVNSVRNQQANFTEFCTRYVMFLHNFGRSLVNFGGIFISKTRLEANSVCLHLVGKLKEVI